MSRLLSGANETEASASLPAKAVHLSRGRPTLLLNVVIIFGLALGTLNGWGYDVFALANWVYAQTHWAPWNENGWYVVLGIWGLIVATVYRLIIGSVPPGLGTLIFWVCLGGMFFMSANGTLDAANDAQMKTASAAIMGLVCTLCYFAILTAKRFGLMPTSR